MSWTGLNVALFGNCLTSVWIPDDHAWQHDGMCASMMFFPVESEVSSVPQKEIAPLANGAWFPVEFGGKRKRFAPCPNGAESSTAKIFPVVLSTVIATT